MSKILIAKVGTDAHDMGVTVVARWLRAAGHEVKFMGIYNTPQQVAQVARTFTPDVIGLSFLGAEPVYMAGRVTEELAHAGIEALLVVGGVITPEMAKELAELGVKAVFTPGTSREAIVDGIAEVLAGALRNAPPAQRINPYSPAQTS